MEDSKVQKMGRPEIEIDMQLAIFCRLKPSLADCAAFFKCSEDTITNKIKEQTGQTFSVFRDTHLVYTRFNLTRKAIEKAESGDNQMLMFALKNLCGWRDKQPEEVDKVLVQNNIKQAANFDIEERIQQLRESTDKEYLK
ncbi:MAG: hypothetical protein A4S09_02195 [Proteobacteria bacterium SG_bin7]|nr:MAG: hypothetical protein A4S09_02195 [Proteobacteria bacterium SG_bin7]